MKQLTRFFSLALAGIVLTGWAAGSAVAQAGTHEKTSARAAPMNGMKSLPALKPVKDERVPLNLDANEAALVRMEMRQLLSGIQLIIDAAQGNDMKAVMAAAKPLGVAANREVMMVLMPKLPMEFRTLGNAMHSGFDQLALDAESMGDAKLSMKTLSETMQKCVACHATYRIATEPFPRMTRK